MTGPQEQELRDLYGEDVARSIHDEELEQARIAMTAGELVNPGWSYRLPQDGTPLAGPCDTPRCVYLSKPGGARHDGDCEVRS